MSSDTETQNKQESKNQVNNQKGENSEEEFDILNEDIINEENGDNGENDIKPSQWDDDLKRFVLI